MKRPGSMSRQEAAQWFIANRTEQDENGCIVAQKSLSLGGYASLRYGDKTYAAHRFIYAALVGEIPEGMDVCHHCDNRACVNVAHLFVGTRRDNMQDAKRKGRNYKPYANHVLTPTDALEIRQKYANGSSSKWLAEKYGVSTRSILNILNGKNFAYAGGPRFKIGQPKGEWHANAKLDESAVQEIRRAYGKGEKTQVELADYYKVHQSTINSILLGKTWRHVK